MTARKLTIEQARDMRDTWERTSASFSMLGHVFGVDRSIAWAICRGKTYNTDVQTYGPQEEPTPHGEITYDGWNRNTTPLPPLEVIYNAHRAAYAAQNERDGYLTDPEYLAAVAAWRAEPLTLAAD